MNAIQQLLPEGLLWRPGWMLVHFIWQGAAIALLTAVLPWLWSKRSANARYAIGSAALLLCGASVVTTFILVPAPPKAEAAVPLPEARPVGAAAVEVSGTPQTVTGSPAIPDAHLQAALAAGADDIDRYMDRGGAAGMREDLAELQRVATRPAGEGTTAISTQPATGESLRFRVVSARTGAAVAGVSLTTRIGREAGPAATTNNEGEAVLPMPIPWPSYLEVLAERDGFIPSRIRWSKWRDQPGPPREYTLELPPGTTIGGLVRDENGRPVQDATIQLTLRADNDSSNGVEVAINNATVTTDQEGRWRYDRFPPGPQKLFMKMQHPDFVRRSIAGLPMDGLRDQTSVVVLEKGVPVSGLVTDLEGQPIPAASVTLGQTFDGALAPQAQSDEQGRYILPYVDPRLHVLTATAPGYAPELREVQVEEGSAPVHFKLGSARPLFGRVIGSDEKPVTSGVVQVTNWRGYNSVWWQDRLDAEGRFRWDDAPADELQVLLAAGNAYMNSTQKIRASDHEFVLRMRKLPDNFYEREERPAEKIQGVVQLADGSPAAGAHVFASSGMMMMNDNRVVGGGGQEARARSGTDGTFSLRKLSDAFFVVITHEEGYAQVTGEDFLKSSEVRLSPWGRIEGVALVGGKPAANETVNVDHHWMLDNPTRTERRRMPLHLMNLISVSTDDQGRFQIDRVPPGTHRIGLRQQIGVSRSTTTNTVAIEVLPGQTSRVSVGGIGRPVTGRFVPPEPGQEIDWSRGHYRLRSSARSMGFTPAVQPDGRFRVEDVPAGSYALKGIVFQRSPGAGQSALGRQIGSIGHQFTMPEIEAGRADEPLDLGEIRMRAESIRPQCGVGTTTQPAVDLSVGDAAPAFEAKTLDGQPLHLADYRGRHVLLGFWATWCGPCVAEIPALMEVYRQFGDDKRFVMIGLSLDAQPDQPREFSARHEIPWIQAHLGEWSKTSVPAKYGVQGIPSIFLIDPEGRIIGKALHGENVAAAVEAALDSP